jgi:hypothetical protein
MTMNVKQTFAAIRALGLSVDYTNGEWRITYKLTSNDKLGCGPVVGPISRKIARERQEACAYYTNDNDDALATATMMAGIGDDGSK